MLVITRGYLNPACEVEHAPHIHDASSSFFGYDASHFWMWLHHRRAKRTNHLEVKCNSQWVNGIRIFIDFIVRICRFSDGFFGYNVHKMIPCQLAWSIYP